MFGNQRLLLAIVLLFAFAVRVSFACYWHSRAEADGQLFRFGDSHSYWTLAEQISHGRPYQYGSENARIFRAPGLPTVLSPFTLVPEQGRGVLLARVFLCFVSTLGIAVLMLAANELAGRCAAWACGAIAAIYPSAIGMSVLILSEAIFVPLMCGQLLFWQKAWQEASARKRNRYAVLAGVCAALAVLTRPSWLLFLPFLVCSGVMVGPERKRHLWVGLFSVLAFMVCMSPWWIRNATVTGRFVPTTLQVGPSLLDSLRPEATGASDQNMDFMKQVLEEQLSADSRSAQPLESTLEYRLNRRATQQATDWALENPMDVLALAGRKFARTWSVWPDGGDVSSNWMRLAITLGCFGTLALAGIGYLLALKPIRWRASIWIMPCIYFTLLHMVFVGSIRYREPAVYAMTVLAGCGLAWLAGCQPRNGQIVGNLQGSSAEKKEPSSFDSSSG